MKDQPHRPQRVQSLPELARRWMNAYYVRRKKEAGPHLRVIYGEIDELASFLQLPDYSIKTFRDLHFLHAPDSSVAGLSISDELFLDVIEAGIDTINDLARKLESRDISTSFSFINSNGNITALRQALQQWQASSNQMDG